jgi:hypothetical protein
VLRLFRRISPQSLLGAPLLAELDVDHGEVGLRLATAGPDPRPPGAMSMAPLKSFRAPRKSPARTFETPAS